MLHGACRLAYYCHEAPRNAREFRDKTLSKVGLVSGPSQARAIRTKQRIIIAAAQAVNEASFESTTLADIARRANVTTGALYFHFASKEALAHAVIAAQNEYSQRRARDTMALGLPMLEVTLRVSADFTFDILRDPIVCAGARLTSQVLAWENPPLGPFDGWLAFNTMLLEAGKHDGVVDPELDVRRTAEFIVGGYTGHYIFSTLLNDLPGLPERILTMWDFFIRTAVISDSDGWLSRAEELFRGRAVPEALTLDEATEVHLHLAEH